MDYLENSNVLLSLFFFMHTFGWIGSSLLLLTVLLSPKVHRHCTWVNLCVSWIFACFGFSLLLTSGQITRPVPSPDLCLAQAAAIYAGPPLTAGTTLSLAIHLWRTICRPIDYAKDLSSHPVLRRNPIFDILLVLCPYFGAVSIYIGVLTVGLQRRDLVVLASSRMYCGLNDPIPGRISAIYVGGLTLATILIECLVLSHLYRTYRAAGFKALGPTFPVISRLVAFSFFGIFALSISLTYLSNQSYGRLPNVLMALPALTFVLIFGSQMDLWRALAFWRSAPPPLEGLRPSKPSFGVNLNDTATDLISKNDKLESFGGR